MAEQLGGVLAKHLVEVGGDGRAGVDHGVAQGAGVVALRGVDPNRFQTKSGFFGFDTFKRAINLARVDGEFAPNHDVAFAAHRAIEHDVVGVGVEAQGVADAHGLDQEAQFCREFFAHTFDAVHQLAAGFGVDQGDEAVADFHANEVDLFHIVPIQLFGSVVGGCGRGYRVVLLDLFSQRHEAHTRGGKRQQQKDEVGHARDHAQQCQDTGRDEQGRRVGQLVGCLLGHRLRGCYTRDDDGGGQRQEEGRNLCH